VIEMIVTPRLETLDMTMHIASQEMSREIGNEAVSAIITVSAIVITTNETLEDKVDIVKDRLVLRHDALILLQEEIMKTKWRLIQCMLAW
jgi:hypothetical protein